MLLDTFSIVLAAIVGACLTWLTYENDLWMAFYAYISAVAIMVVGLYVSKKKPDGFLSYIMGVLIPAFLCIMATLNVTQLIAELLSIYIYGGGGKEPKFVEVFSHGNSPGFILLWTILPIVAVMTAKHWMDSFFKQKLMQEGKTTKNNNLMDKVCRCMLAILDSRVTLVVLIFYVGVSFFIGQRLNDMSIFSASGGVVTIFGLFSIIKFTTVDKYLRREEIAYNSTGVTGPPVSDEELGRVMTANREAARVRLEKELRTEMTGVFMTVVGTVIWAYGGYIPYSLMS